MSRVVAALLLLMNTASVLAADAEMMRRFDRNSNDRIERNELIAYFKSRGATDDEATDAATDAFTTFGCPLPCDRGITVAQAADVVDEVFTPKTEEDSAPTPPCKFFSIKRTVADKVDPRSPENDFPAVLSYKHDENADDTDQLNVLGAVEIFNCIVNRGDPQLLNIRTDSGAGLDFEIDGSTPPEDSSVQASAPFSFTWISEDDRAPITKVVTTLTPKFGTDRAFDRAVYEASATLTLQSRPFARAGLRTFLPSFNNQVLSIWWQPSILAEWTDIADAAGNEDLSALEDTSFRVGLRADVIVRPSFLNERLAFKFKGFQRYDTSGGDSRSYTESSVTYNLNEDGKAQFTAIYSHGRKPPAFSANDQWLIGIGIQR